jgi:outer membrane protein assembly factor BamB
MMNILQRMVLMGKAAGNKHIYAGDGVRIGFEYHVEAFDPVTGKVLWQWEKHNLIPDAARSYCLAAMFTGGVQYSSFYVGVFGNDRTPLYSDTSSDLPDYGELTSFDETTRQLWIPAAETNGTLESSANPAVFTAASDLTVRGVFLSTSSVFGSTAGVLMSAVLGPSPETLSTDAQLRVPVTMTLTT